MKTKKKPKAKPTIGNSTEMSKAIDTLVDRAVNEYRKSLWPPRGRKVSDDDERRKGVGCFA